MAPNGAPGRAQLQIRCRTGQTDPFAYLYRKNLNDQEIVRLLSVCVCQRVRVRSLCISVHVCSKVLKPVYIQGYRHNPAHCY